MPATDLIRVPGLPAGDGSIPGFFDDPDSPGYAMRRLKNPRSPDVPPRTLSPTLYHPRPAIPIKNPSGGDDRP